MSVSNCFKSVFFLSVLRLEQHRGVKDAPLIWDLTHNIQFANWKEEEHQDVIPCLLRGHRYFHVGRSSSSGCMFLFYLYVTVLHSAVRTVVAVCLLFVRY